MKRLIAPSILASNFENLKADIEMLNASEADWIHFDIMDGVYVPNISFGFPVLECVRKIAKKPLDVHLMIVEPERYFERFRDAGANHLTVHIEACRHLHRAVEEIKSLGMMAGVSLNPHTSVDLLENILSDLDIVLIMSVNPGFGGQVFIENTYKKIEKLRKMCNSCGKDVLIEVDGGVDQSNALSLFNAGADVLVTGTTVFRANDPAAVIRDLKRVE